MRITREEKAKELVNRFSEFTEQSISDKKNYNAIECALICMDEIRDGLKRYLIQLYKEQEPTATEHMIQTFFIHELQLIQKEIEKL